MGSRKIDAARLGWRLDFQWRNRRYDRQFNVGWVSARLAARVRGIGILYLFGS
jgi:hypothetical protein